MRKLSSSLKRSTFELKKAYCAKDIKYLLCTKLHWFKAACLEGLAVKFSESTITYFWEIVRKNSHFLHFWVSNEKGHQYYMTSSDVITITIYFLCSLLNVA